MKLSDPLAVIALLLSAVLLLGTWNGQHAHAEKIREQVANILQTP